MLFNVITQNPKYSLSEIIMYIYGIYKIILSTFLYKEYHLSQYAEHIFFDSRLELPERMADKQFDLKLICKSIGQSIT